MGRKSSKTKTEEQVLDLFKYLLDANGLEDRKRETTGTLPTIFFRYAGHVNMIEVDLHKDGWKSGFPSDKTWQVYLDRPLDEGWIKDVKAHIEEALKTQTEAELLAADVKRAEAELAKKRNEVNTLKKRLERAQQNEANDK